MPNRLAKETSPYLLQHADNPVNWYPWGDEALRRAREEDRPILLSIGYSACHWCHVMAHESFEDEAIAAVMNRSFINIKVDREERPDLDSIYMEAVQAMTGSGGWPLTVFLTPEGKPFFGGTYFPPRDIQGMAGFPRVLGAVADAYHQRRSDIARTTGQLEAALARQPATISADPAVAETLDEANLALKQAFDCRNGGFGGAPKFPQPMALEFLLRYYHSRRDAAAMEMVDFTLEQMARGGIYDQIGGGFHRYATDSRWLVPHFEKMLYDNAQLSQIYLHAYLATGKPFFRSIAEETLDYVLREMTDARGGFYSAQDADSEGVEGQYYVWTAEEIEEALEEKQANAVTEYYGVTRGGNFEGKNILHVTTGLPPEAADVIIQAKTALRQRRERRVKPGRDDKILTSWNGLMLASLAEAAGVFDRRDYRNAAAASGTFILNSMTSNGHLQHSYKDGSARIDGYLLDYATVIEGFLALHQLTFQGQWLRQAITLAEVMLEQFWDGAANTFYDSSREQKDLFIRPRDITDGALPSGASMAATVLLKLSKLADNESWKKIAAQALQSVQPLMRQNPLMLGNWLCALDFHLSDVREIAIVGPPDDPRTVGLWRTLNHRWLPNKVVAARDPGDPSPASDLKLLQGRPMIDGQPAVYVCQHYTCQTPITDTASLEQQLSI
jgi:uncharacterized protein YyaL (SSP411 family)